MIYQYSIVFQQVLILKIKPKRSKQKLKRGEKMSKVTPTAEKGEIEEFWVGLSDERKESHVTFETDTRVSANVLTDKENQPPEKFDEFLIEAIDEALTSLGEPVKNAVYYHLENDFNMPKNEIPQRLGFFSHIIHKIFGIGASRLEIKFMKNLSSKVKANTQFSEYEWPLSKWIVMEMSFTDYIDKIRKNYEKQMTPKH